MSAAFEFLADVLCNAAKRGHALDGPIGRAVADKLAAATPEKRRRLLALSPELRTRAARGLVLLCEREARQAAQQGASS